MCISAQANDYDFPTMSESTCYNGKYAPLAAPTAIAPNEKTVYQAGLFDQMTMIGNDILEPIATSAFISAVDYTKTTPLWTVGITGAAHISLITATDEAVYVAGTYADDITFGSKDFTTKTINGTSASHDYVNAFIAKYTSEGNLVAAEGILPHKNSEYADNEGYDSDLCIEPTAIQLFNGKIYISFNFLGGYSTEGIKVDGNLKSSYGFYDSRCCAIVSYDATSLTDAQKVLDLRNAETVNENGMCPQSICLTADASNLYVASFLSGDNTLTIADKTQSINFDHNENEQVYGAVVVTIADDGSFKTSKKTATASDRAYVMNNIAWMKADGSNLYIAGNVSTPLPFDTALVPDLWTDQFAACLSTADFSCTWSSITGAKKADIANANDKYRKSISASLNGNELTVIGKTNFTCSAKGLTPAYTENTCLGIASSASMYAITTKTDNGCKLSVAKNASTGIEAVTPEEKGSEAMYDLSGRGIASPAKGQIFIKSNKKIIAK